MRADAGGQAPRKGYRSGDLNELECPSRRAALAEMVWRGVVDVSASAVGEGRKGDGAWQEKFVRPRDREPDRG